MAKSYRFLHKDRPFVTKCSLRQDHYRTPTHRISYPLPDFPAFYYSLRDGKLNQDGMEKSDVSALSEANRIASNPYLYSTLCWSKLSYQARSFAPHSTVSLLAESTNPVSPSSKLRRPNAHNSTYLEDRCSCVFSCQQELRLVAPGNRRRVPFTRMSQRTRL